MNCWICQEHETCPFPVCVTADAREVAMNEIEKRKNNMAEAGKEAKKCEH